MWDWWDLDWLDGGFHAPVIQAVEGLRLAAVVQRTGDDARKIYPNTRVVRSIEELLAIETIRLVVIATPNQTHFPFAMQSLQAGAGMWWWISHSRIPCKRRWSWCARRRGLGGY